MSLLVVLVRTHNPGNLGGAARAAKNFGASLLLVAPRVSRDHLDALAYASGAEDVLAEAPVVPDLGAARERAERLVVLSGLRGRAISGLPPRASAAELRREAAARSVALVFGPERGGLTTEEMRQGDSLFALPSRAEFPTLNLAQAVAAALALASSGRDAGTKDGRASSRELERLFSVLRETLRLAGYPGRGHSAEVLAEVESYLKRGRPTSREVTLLLGALAALRRRMESGR